MVFRRDSPHDCIQIFASHLDANALVILNPEIEDELAAAITELLQAYWGKRRFVDYFSIYLRPDDDEPIISVSSRVGFIYASEMLPVLTSFFQQIGITTMKELRESQDAARAKKGQKVEKSLIGVGDFYHAPRTNEAFLQCVNRAIEEMKKQGLFPNDPKK